MLQKAVPEMKDHDMRQNYPFDWMDETVEVILNPQVSRVRDIAEEELTQLQQRFEQESTHISNSLKTVPFSSHTREQVNVTVGLYHIAISVLRAQAENNLKLYMNDGPLIAVGKVIVNGLEKLNDRLQRRYASFLHEPNSNKMRDPATDQPGKPKVTCTLTVDQIGLILKAADESRLLISSSLSMVFKTIVPYLSTSVKKDLSWDSMRSNSYHPEKKDKEAAIEALKLLIKKINES